MQKTCCAAAALSVARITPVAFALAVMLAMGSPASAASIGHSRLVSAPGQPLQIDVPIRELTDTEQQSLRVSAAPLAAWQQAGLTPPVELSSLQVSVESGFSPNSRLVRVRSSQPFTGVVADLLLQINTAAGSQQHQVSLLASSSSPVTAVSEQAGTRSPSSSNVALGAPASSGTISVRRGDTLFALARANAVDGVSVYQMMLALQKANPQAFIQGNMNLLKAGAKLSIPDAGALRAVSDHEARRIFQQHAQAFATYRQAVAGRRAAAVTGGSTQSGTLSKAPAVVAAAPSPAASDQVVLSSGSANDARADEREATQRNIAESESRVSQLERNVQSLNQALQMQGEAAKDAVLEGAAVVSQTLSDAATSIGIGADEPAGAQNGGSGESGTDTPSGSAANVSAEPAKQRVGAAATSEQASQDGRAASQGVEPNDRTTVSDPQQSGEPAGPSAGSDNRQAGSTQEPVTLAAQGGTAEAEGTLAGRAGLAPTPAIVSEEPNITNANTVEQPVSWLQQNLLGVITAILALVVLIIAWVLRRASASRGGDGHGVVTEAMVQERLEKIDLDLSHSPYDGRPPHAG